MQETKNLNTNFMEKQNRRETGRSCRWKDNVSNLDKRVIVTLDQTATEFIPLLSS